MWERQISLIERRVNTTDQHQMLEAKKNERANALKEVKRLFKEFGFTAYFKKLLIDYQRDTKMNSFRPTAMLIKILKACLPPIFIAAVRKIRFDSPNDLFDGDDALFKDLVKKVDVYGEYGCGKSTKWVLNNASAYVIAVDTSSEWVDAVTRDNQSNNDRLNIHHSDLGTVGEWGRPLSYEKMDDFSDYTDYIWKQNKSPKLVMVDGRFRVCCFLTSLKLAEEGTKILFDDYTNRPQYHFVEKYVSRVKEYGRQCLFVVPLKSEIDMDELDRDIASFRIVMD